MESGDRLRFVSTPDRMAHGEEVGASTHQRRTVRGRDPANGHARNLEYLLPPGEQVGLGAVLALLGGAGEECAEGDIVRTGLAGLHREVPTGVAGDADLRFPTESLARLANIAIALPEVNPIGMQPLGERNRVVHDEGTVLRRANLLERRGQSCRLMLIDPLHPELECRNRSGSQSALEPLRETAANVERRDHVKGAIRHAGSGNAHSGNRKRCACVMASMRTLLTALAPALLSACAVVPAPDSTPPAPSGSAVALGQRVRVGDLTVTPVSVVEDSRCPINARCVWAGRLVVRTQVDGDGWRDTADMRLGETFGTHGRVIALTSGEPGKIAERETPPEAYRFTYEAR